MNKLVNLPNQDFITFYDLHLHPVHLSSVRSVSSSTKIISLRVWRFFSSFFSISPMFRGSHAGKGVSVQRGFLYFPPSKYLPPPMFRFYKGVGAILHNKGSAPNKKKYKVWLWERGISPGTHKTVPDTTGVGYVKLSNCPSFPLHMHRVSFHFAFPQTWKPTYFFYCALMPGQIWEGDTYLQHDIVTRKGWPLSFGCQSPMRKLA